MKRIGYNSRGYYDAKAKLTKRDGIQCIICGRIFERPDKRKSYCSPKCFSNWYESLNIDWRLIRDIVLSRDGGCVKCGVKFGSKMELFKYGIKRLCDVRFEVHHIKPISEGGKEFDPDNCITLCYDCHKNMHNRIGNIQRHNKTLESIYII